MWAMKVRRMTSRINWFSMQLYIWHFPTSFQESDFDRKGWRIERSRSKVESYKWPWIFPPHMPEFSFMVVKRGEASLFSQNINHPLPSCNQPWLNFLSVTVLMFLSPKMSDHPFLKKQYECYKYVINFGLTCSTTWKVALYLQMQFTTTHAVFKLNKTWWTDSVMYDSLILTTLHWLVGIHKVSKWTSEIGITN